jgi:anti-sigma factor RsiW
MTAVPGTHLDDALDALGGGDRTTAAEEQAHLDACARCRARLALARQVDRVLAARPQPPLPEGFPGAVMARVGQERWRVEQALDIGFNIAVAAGVLLVATGLLGLAWASGGVVIGVDLARLTGEALSVLGARLLPQAQVVTAALLLLAGALGAWWWAEDDLSV